MARKQWGKELTELTEKANGLWGEKDTCFVAMEECGELIQAISKVQRYGLGMETRCNLVEEIADVMIVAERIAITYGVSPKEVDAIKNAKMKRFKSRINQFESEKNPGSDFSEFMSVPAGGMMDDGK